MINRESKASTIEEIKTQIDKAQAIFLTNLVGIPSNDAVRIRKTVRDAKGMMMVARNSLFAKASKGTKAEALLASLKGPSAVAFAYEDSAAVAKAVFDASKEFEELIPLRGGLLGEQNLTKAEVEALAKLPSKNAMLATLLATFNAPVSAFVRTLDAIKTQKEAAA
ncbi:MAG: 50S ribosomal protein L10 [Bacteriovoracaceae bacterium]|nr:50S ribosomal protein L10 [Bacteriovoracaceae bacterium]